MADTPTANNLLQVSGDHTHIIGDDKFDFSEAIKNPDRYVKTFVTSSCKKDNSPIKGIQSVIQNLQNKISDIKKYSNINSILNELDSGKSSKVVSLIKKIVNTSASDIAAYVKNILGGVRGWVLKKIQDGAKKILPFLFPGEVPSFVDKLNTSLDGISCAFAKIVRSLFKTIGNLLLQLVDEYINGPLCLIEDFIGKLLNQILQPLFNAIQTALKFINLGISIAENILNNVFNILDFVSGILKFFICDDDKACPVEDQLNLAGFAEQLPVANITNIAFDPNLNLSGSTA